MKITNETIYQLYYGEDVDNLLWKLLSEDPAAFTARKERSSYENWLKKAIDIYTGYIFYNSTTSEEGKELGLIPLAVEATVHSLLGGVSVILCLQKGMKVYNVLDLGFKQDPFRHTSKVCIGGQNPVEIDLEEGTISQKIMEEGEEREETEPFSPEQLVLVQWSTGYQSLVYNVAKTCIKILNFESLKDYLKLISSIWYLEGPDIAGTNGLPAPFSYIKKSGPDGLNFVMPPVEAKIALYEEENEKLIAKVGRVLGIEAEFSEDLSGKFSTGIAKAFAMIDTNAIISAIAYNIQQAVNQASSVYWALNGNAGDAPTIKLDPFLRPAGNLETMTEIKAAAEFINTPQAYIEAKKEIAKLQYRFASSENLKKLLDEIDLQGGAPPRNQVQELINF